MIKIFTLNSGDDIIAEMLDEDEEFIILKDPLIIKYAFSTKGGMYIQLKYYGMFSSDSIFSFKKSSICSACYPKDNMAEYYGLSVEISKEELIPDVDAMIDHQITSIQSYNMTKQLETRADAVFTDLLQKVSLKNMQ